MMQEYSIAATGPFLFLFSREERPTPYDDDDGVSRSAGPEASSPFPLRFVAGQLRRLQVDRMVDRNELELDLESVNEHFPRELVALIIRTTYSRSYALPC